MNCDIIMAVWNEPDVTRQCLESIFQHTHTPFHLIIIDNASDTAGRRMLEEYGHEKTNVVLIRNEQNLGFVKATNQGLKIASADYICLLNNDTIVTPNWLELIIRVMEESADIGIANPQSNDLGLRLGRTGIDAYAQNIRDVPGYIETDYCKGFCLVMKKQVLDKAGLLDENFGRGGFEETDFCHRAGQLGYKRVRVNNAYVHHLGAMSFRRVDKKEFGQLDTRNRDYYYQKWGKPKRFACVLFGKEVKASLMEWMLDTARQWHQVYVLLKTGTRYNPQVIHSNIKVFRYPGIFFIGLALFKVLHRRKKSFDAVITDNDFFAWLLRLRPGLEIETVEKLFFQRSKSREGACAPTRDFRQRGC